MSGIPFSTSATGAPAAGAAAPYAYTRQWYHSSTQIKTLETACRLFNADKGDRLHARTVKEWIIAELSAEASDDMYRDQKKFLTEFWPFKSAVTICDEIREKKQSGLGKKRCNLTSVLLRNNLNDLPTEFQGFEAAYACQRALEWLDCCAEGVCHYTNSKMN
ncbi:hypothetical protein CkaCkLH20_09315 [Colletotrichum karsti]|uniref:Uncharacterized protein n=1 Tax=Colletotrichum karsti TaxID=1095194 RepID=A0A9P6LI24_9PEZI|nr:uncharacterized protein CkaCkLH20_09315 [Colletotrichum karsti]KAF9873152.1 hypothetical protein CkaCkLH20_09315 [Colletotrichum karsti]